MLSRCVFHGLLLTCFLSPMSLRSWHDTAQSQHPDVLSRRVESLALLDATMEDALRALRATNQNEILIGFEAVAHRADEVKKTMSLTFSDATVAEILNALCRKDPRYTYELVDGLVIHVRPLNSYVDSQNLLDIRIHDFSVQGSMLPAAVIVQIGELAPELSSYIAKKQSEYYKSRRIEPAFPGVTMHGNMEPQIKLHMQDVSVRQILNAVVLYSYELNKNSKPDWTGNKLVPTSWMYDFIIDPAAPTGLGGYPRWITF